jgi:uncharacterized protein
MDQAAVETIKNRLSGIEAEHSVRIIYAVESGSRAWGFESTDSDYDVRFIYCHKPDWYLNILPRRDVIEYPIIDLFDFSGWDLRKTLFLLNKSNPVLFEWLRSPIVYMQDNRAVELLRLAAKEYFSPVSSIYHYLHMATGNFRTYLRENMVRIKKYFYVLRPVFACMWIERFNEAPPMEFETLLGALDLDPGLGGRIRELLARKRSGVELGLEPKIAEISAFLGERIGYYEKKTEQFNPAEKPGSGYLDRVFVDILKTGKNRKENFLI